MMVYVDGMESRGPCGYLCLGLSYHWDNKEKVLLLEKLILVEMDIALRKCVEILLYYDLFMRSVDEITEKDGKYYYKECPILNYHMLNMPKRLTEVTEAEDYFLSRKERRLIQSNGNMKYSVNRVCNPTNIFFEDYTERYACVLNFDKETLHGDVLGFDCLGKLYKGSFNLQGLTNVYDIRKNILKEMVLFYPKYSKETQERIEECGILNFDFVVNQNKELSYEYRSIWEL